MVVTDLVAYLVASLAAVIMPLLAVFDPVGSVRCPRPLRNAGALPDTWPFAYTWPLANTWPFADARPFASTGTLTGCRQGSRSGT